ncbi:MAG: hypothetical protein J7L53_07165 [Deltaproteobacteria bacterium]|nr:hypothetical protein [Deltaproteobacteria bacterium]
MGKIVNLSELGRKAFFNKKYFSETAGKVINPTELVAMLICEEDSFEAGIKNVFDLVSGLLHRPW